MYEYAVAKFWADDPDPIATRLSTMGEEGWKVVGMYTYQCVRDHSGGYREDSTRVVYTLERGIQRQ